MCDDFERIWQQSRKEFENAWQQSYDELRRYALKLYEQNNARAEDLLQDTTARAWNYWQAMRHRNNVRAWLYQIMGNCFVDDVRRNAGIELVSLDKLITDDSDETRLDLLPSNDADMDTLVAQGAMEEELWRIYEVLSEEVTPEEIVLYQIYHGEGNVMLALEVLLSRPVRDCFRQVNEIVSRMPADKDRPPTREAILQSEPGAVTEEEVSIYRLILGLGDQLDDLSRITNQEKPDLKEKINRSASVLRERAAEGWSSLPLSETTRQQRDSIRLMEFNRAFAETLIDLYTAVHNGSIKCLLKYMLIFEMYYRDAENSLQWTQAEIGISRGCAVGTVSTGLKLTEPLFYQHFHNVHDADEQLLLEASNRFSPKDRAQWFARREQFILMCNGIEVVRPGRPGKD